jgi:riboflavin synthase
MFTGIVEEVGSVRRVLSGQISGEMEIKASYVLDGTKIGDSIAVNGVCLTVTALHADGFTADVMPETLRRTNLGQLKSGDPVNLERAMAADGRFGGHIVSGHIDGTGQITQQHREGNAVWVRIQTDADILRLIVEKGSIAIDGISLTVASVSDTDFQVSIIPHTGSETILLQKRPGDLVNLENDIVGKYVQRLLQPASAPEAPKSRITMEFLAEHGF